MKDKWKEYWAVPRNRLMTLILAGLLLCLAALEFTGDSEVVLVTDAPAPAPLQQSVPAPKEPKKAREVMPIPPDGSDGAIKDPFAPPDAYAPKVQPSAQSATVSGGGSTSGSGSAARGGTATDKAQADKEQARPALTGIVSSGNRRIAILEIGSESKSCSVGERIGAYKVISIASDRATLSGPAGNMTLEVGR